MKTQIIEEIVRRNHITIQGTSPKSSIAVGEKFEIHDVESARTHDRGLAGVLPVDPPVEETRNQRCVAREQNEMDEDNLRGHKLLSRPFRRTRSK
jgi:hypothetical protein